ncbi:MAG: PepSY domain-containing protein [Steroidobacteraceae bacterium]
MNIDLRVLAGLLLLVAAVPRAGAEGGAHTGFSCNEPKDTWQKQMALQRQLKSTGWRVRRILVMNGCYEVYGFDAQGERVEAFFNPRTLIRMENTASE